MQKFTHVKLFHTMYFIAKHRADFYNCLDLLHIRDKLLEPFIVVEVLVPIFLDSFDKIGQTAVVKKPCAHVLKVFVCQFLVIVVCH